MENAMGMETVLFGGPPEIGNILKLANSQIGFMTIFAHPLFQNVTDIIPAMGFAPAEILTNKGVWFTKAEHEKRKEQLRRDSEFGDGGAISPRSQSPVGPHKKRLLGHQSAVEEEKVTSYFPASPLKNVAQPSTPECERRRSYVGSGQHSQTGKEAQSSGSRRSSVGEPLSLVTGSGNSSTSRRSSGVLSGGNTHTKGPTSQNNTISTSQLHSDSDGTFPENTIRRGSSENEAPRRRSQTEVPQYDGADDRAADVRTATGLPYHDDVASNSHTRPDQSFSSGTPPLSPFTFATSRPGEPTRTYDPSANSQVNASHDRASGPNSNYDRISMATSGAATTSDPDVGARTALGALSPSTEATSVVSAESEGGRTSEQTEDYGSQKDSEPDFETRRARAASAPTKTPFSLPHRGSSDSSKQDVRTTVLGQDSPNGDVAVRGGTMPRRRSRLRLQFWKKRSDSEE